MTFLNSAKPITVDDSTRGIVKGVRQYGVYKYDAPSPYLLVWSRLLQKVLSQAATFLLTRKFHTSECAIYKAEGGINVGGVGELVLGASECYWDSFNLDVLTKRTDPLFRLAGLITRVVLDWEPMRPIDSLMLTAAVQVNTTMAQLSEAVAHRALANPFGGNQLSNFFDRARYHSIDRDYQRYCMLTIEHRSPDDVQQYFDDHDLARQLHAQLRAKAGDRFHVFGCSPDRRPDGLWFWVNCGRKTAIDGWHTHAELKEWLAS